MHHLLLTVSNARLGTLIMLINSHELLQHLKNLWTILNIFNNTKCSSFQIYFFIYFPKNENKCYVK